MEGNQLFVICLLGTELVIKTCNMVQVHAMQ